MNIKDAVRSVCQTMWDIGLRVSPATRTLADCARFDQDNLEFTLSLLDCRFLAGDSALFERLHDKALPQLDRARIRRATAVSVGDDARAAPAFRQHDFPSGAQLQGRSGQACAIATSRAGWA